MIYKASEKKSTICHVFSFKEKNRITFFLIIVLRKVKGFFIGKMRIMYLFYAKAVIHKMCRKTESGYISIDFVWSAARCFILRWHVFPRNIFQCYTEKLFAFFRQHIMISTMTQCYFLVILPVLLNVAFCAVCFFMMTYNQEENCQCAS